MFDDDPIKRDEAQLQEEATGEIAERQAERRHKRDEQLRTLGEYMSTAAILDKHADADAVDERVVDELREAVKRGKTQLGFTPPPREELQQEHGLDPSAVDRVPEAERAELLDTLEQAESMAAKAETNGLAERHLRNLEDSLVKMGAEHSVSPRSLAPEIEGLQASLSARLSDGAGPAELSSGLSDRQKVATLRDREEDLEADLAEAADAFERLHLQDRLGRVRDKRAELEGDADADGGSDDLADRLEG